MRVKYLWVVSCEQQFNLVFLISYLYSFARPLRTPLFQEPNKIRDDVSTIHGRDIHQFSSRIRRCSAYFYRSWILWVISCLRIRTLGLFTYRIVILALRPQQYEPYRSGKFVIVVDICQFAQWQQNHQFMQFALVLWSKHSTFTFGVFVIVGIERSLVGGM